MDLRRFIRLGVEHIYQAAVNRRRECLPFLRFNLTSPPTWARHEYWSSPHMVGRFLDALALCADVVDVPNDEEVIAIRYGIHGAYIGLFFSTGGSHATLVCAERDANSP